jgi:phosphoadenosine phosphosulfate reductase
MNATQEAVSLELLAPDDCIHRVIEANPGAPACLTCSFQAEDMVVLDLLRPLLPEIAVIFLDTGYHFRETYEYRDRMVAEWNLNLINVTPQTTVAEHEAKLGVLYLVDPTQCCELRKVQPLFRSLEPFQLWFTGLRREQSPTRAKLRQIEEHRLSSGKLLQKVSPIVGWTWSEVERYVAERRIPLLPLYDQGYRSIGCEPCTAVSDDPANPRAGRWGGKKLECGIHTFVPPPAQEVGRR